MPCDIRKSDDEILDELAGSAIIKGRMAAGWVDRLVREIGANSLCCTRTVVADLRKGLRVYEFRVSLLDKQEVEDNES